ncbi:MAG: T9SS type A sorting domain-containing protein, partial [Bacteroidota bacterium]
GTIDIGSLKPGKDSIYEFTWTILDPNIHQNWATCLLARIENSVVDPITVYKNRINNDVYFNNNIAMKNLTIVDMLLGRLVPVNDVLRPDGRYVYIGNVADVEDDFDFEFAVPTNIIGHPITEEANVRIYFDEDGWSIFEGYVNRTRGIRVVEDRVIQIMEPNVQIRGVRFPAETRIPIYVGFEARGEPHPEKTEFEYHLSQYESGENTLLGGEHFQIRREEGMRRTVVPGSQQLVEGINAGLGEEPQLTLFPNPARQFAMVDYQLGEVKMAELKIWNAVGSFTARQVLDVNGRRSRIDLSEYPKGVYFVALMCDGKTIDVQSLVVTE